MQRQNAAYRVSLFGQIALVIAVIAYLFGTTFRPENVASFYTMLFILTLGIVLSFTMVGVRFIAFDKRTLIMDVVNTAVCVVSILVVNRYVPAEIGISPIGEMAFGILAGVSEEWFFRLWLAAWIHKITRSMLLAIPISSFAWAIFHISRYGSNPNAIFLVFLCGFPLAYITLTSRSVDGASFAHSIVNFLARR